MYFAFSLATFSPASLPCENNCRETHKQNNDHVQPPAVNVHLIPKMLQQIQAINEEERGKIYSLLKGWALTYPKSVIVNF